MRDQWYDLATILNSVHLNDEKGSVYWKWTPSRSFIVKSVYEHLTKDECGPKFQRIWKAKIPIKIKTFMWLIKQQAILTKDNMLRRKWQGILHVIFVMPLKQLIIYSLNVPLQRLYAVL
jgi:hypothetical protein